MNQHTKGPWKVRGGVNEMFIDAPPIVCLAVVNSLDETPKEVRQCKANARLIAAAPAMLEALQDSVERMVCFIPKAAKGYKEGCFKYVAGGWDIFNCDCPLCKSRAAIAAATEGK